MVIGFRLGTCARLDNPIEGEDMLRRTRSLFALMMIAMLLLTACTASSTGSGTAKPKAVLMVGSLGDRSFNDSAHDGLKMAEKDFKAKVDMRLQEAPEIAAFEENVVQYAKDGYDLIILIGFTYGDMLQKVAPQYPNTNFLLVDSVVDLPNVRSVVFKEHEGSFLAGALAALTSKTGRIGFIGGMDVPIIHRFEGGYEQGAKHVNPDIQVDIAYVGAWGDPAKGKELTTVMYNNGADVVFAAAGGSGAGTIEAAKQEQKFALGVDSNQDHLAPEAMLGSMMKRVDVAVYNTLKDLSEGKFTAGVTVMGLKEDGVVVSGMAPVSSEISIKNATQANLDKLLPLKQEIIDGKITVVDKMSQ
jgi:basic membrane protein A